MKTIIEKYIRMNSGYSSMASVQIGFKKNDLKENRIFNEVQVVPFRSQGFIEGGHPEWIKAAELAITWAINEVNSLSTFDIYIQKLEGRLFIDTNPTIIGTTVIKATWKYLGYSPPKALVHELEKLNLESRKIENQLLIPDFIKSLNQK